MRTEGCLLAVLVIMALGMCVKGVEKASAVEIIDASARHGFVCTPAITPKVGPVRREVRT